MVISKYPPCVHLLHKTPSCPHRDCTLQGEGVPVADRAHITIVYKLSRISNFRRDEEKVFPNIDVSPLTVYEKSAMILEAREEL